MQCSIVVCGDMLRRGAYYTDGGLQCDGVHAGGEGVNVVDVSLVVRGDALLAWLCVRIKRMASPYQWMKSV